MAAIGGKLSALSNRLVLQEPPWIKFLLMLNSEQTEIEAASKPAHLALGETEAQICLKEVQQLNLDNFFRSVLWDPL